MRKSIVSACRRPAQAVLAGTFAACMAVALCGGAARAESAKAPAFITNPTGWHLLGGKYGGKDYQPLPPGMPGAGPMIGSRPDHPHFGNTSGEKPSLRIGDDTSPLLQPWAAQQMRKTNDAILAGGVPYDPAARCWPAGIPTLITFAVEPMYFLHTPKEVILLYQRGQVMRHVYMNQRHSAHVTPSWYGESVGHYEGDTLVVDTIGFNDKSFVDDFNTPHTTALHVVERYKTINDGKMLQVLMTIEDPGTFTKPWSAMKLLGPVNEPFEESLCQVANDDIFHQGLRPVPTAAKPDF